jgi:DNA polymerase I-like protein with 3'-5' exonuclease and polymerase domains
MTRYSVDIETNGLLEDLTQIHTLHLVDLDTKVFQRFDNRTGTDYTEIDVAIDLLQQADILVMHNGIAFDVPAIQKLYPDFKTGLWDSEAGDHGLPRVFDTMVASRVLYPNIMGADYSKFKRRNVPDRLLGKHSLESWGYRLGSYKGDYGKDENGKALDDCWSTWNQEMSDYCEQDIRVTANLYNHLVAFAKEKEVDISVLHMECDVQYIIQEQCRFGVWFDYEKAEKLAVEISGRKAELEVELAKTMLPIEKVEEYFCKKNNSKVRWKQPVDCKLITDKSKLKQSDINKGYVVVDRQGYEKGKKYYRVKIEPFNPTSRAHIVWNLKTKYGWKPTEMTKGGQPSLDDKIMKTLPYPEAPILAEIFMLGKRLGQISDGAQGWLKAYDPDTQRIYGSVNTMGTISSRMSHYSPNLGQVPNMSAEYGPEARACFGVPEGYVQVGCDASGVQLRMLGHYLAAFDGGEYAKQILEGDIHSFNQEKAGLPTRDNAKTFIYGWLFGAGDEKVGKIVGKGRAVGAELKERFLKELPQVAKLSSAIAGAVKRRGFIRALDSRIIPIRSDHSALNFLLQSAEAVMMKKALVYAYCRLKAMEAQFNFILNVHDEIQTQTVSEWAERVGETIRQAIIDAGEFFNLRIPLDGEYKIGNNWADCH